MRSKAPLPSLLPRSWPHDNSPHQLCTGLPAGRSLPLTMCYTLDMPGLQLHDPLAPGRTVRAPKHKQAIFT